MPRPLKAALSAIAFMVLNVALFLNFPDSGAIQRYFAIIVKPGELLIYGDRLSHDAGPFIAANLINLLVYFILFYLFWVLLDRRRDRERPN